MCKLNNIKKYLSAGELSLMIIITAMAGCTNDIASWWPKSRTFETKPPITKNTESLDAREPIAEKNATISPSTSDDPQASKAQQDVNANLERMKAAYENSKINKEAKTANMADINTISNNIKNDANAPANASERPVITPIGRSARITGIEPVKGPNANIKNASAETVKTNKAESVDHVRDIKQSIPIKPAETKPRMIPVTVTPVETDVMAKNVQKIDEEPDAKETLVTETVHPANQSLKLDIPDPESANASLDKLISKLENKLKERPGDTATQVKLHLIYAMLGQWQEALKNNGGKDSTGGELAKNLASIIKVFDNSSISSAEQANQAMQILNNLQDILRRQADMKVNNIQLCREVKNFAYYTKMPVDYFVSGRRLPVIVYFELENFTSKKINEDAYQTLLAVTMEILDNQGKVLWRQHDERIEDMANKQRHDFYIARLITLPPGLPAGKLQLKLTVEDLNGNKVSQKMTTLELK
jgi:hypothetical protein